MNKEVKRVLRELERKGFVVERAQGRCTLIAPSGRRLGISQGGGESHRPILHWANKEMGVDQHGHPGAVRRSAERSDVGGGTANTARRRGSVKRLEQCLDTWEQMLPAEQVSAVRLMLESLAARDVPRSQEARRAFG